MKRILLAALLAFVPTPAWAINDYGQSDDVWAAPMGPGHILLDVRGFYPGPDSLSVACGISPGLEIGLWASPPSLEPYIKYGLPWSLGPVSFGIVAGELIALAPSVDGDVSVEVVAAIALDPLTSVDVGVGFGRGRGRLGHFNVAVYRQLPLGVGVMAEAYANTSSVAPSYYGQHAGITFPVMQHVAGDMGATIVESPLPALLYQLGMTITL